MSQPHAYSEFHPRWHRNRVSTYWWLHRGAYLRFILREMSSVFIAYWVGVLLALIWSLDHGESAYVHFLAWLKTPFALILNTISLFFVVFHAVTWFNLAPKAMVVYFRGRPVSAPAVAGANYGAWLVVTLIVVWAVLA